MKIALPAALLVLASVAAVPAASAQAPASTTLATRSQPGGTSPFLGGVPAGTATAQPVALTLFDAIKRASKTEPEAVRNALAETKNFEAVSGTISINKDRDAEKSAVILAIEGGKAKYRATVAP